nr:transmembrane protein 165-like isoform X2 [Biomphalaria glabrata]
MKHSRWHVLMGSLASLFVMNFMSVLVGYAASIIPKVCITYVSSILFLVFGFKMIQEGWRMSADKAEEEYEEAQEHLQKSEAKEKSKATSRNQTSSMLYQVVIQCFTLTFLAEWGDRSQVATVVLGAKENILGVLLGSLAGNALCTCLAVIGGKLIAEKISIRTVTLVGGVLFLYFAASTFYIDDD